MIQALLLVSMLLFGEDKDIPLSKDQETQIEMLNSQFKEAVTLEELAKTRKENINLKYRLLIEGLKKELKVPENYEFNEASKMFVKKPSEVNKEK